MDSATKEQEELSDEEDFIIDQTTATDEEVVLLRLKEFSYYLVEEIELNLEFCLKLLEERKVPVKPNSKYIFMLSKIAAAVPKIGTGLGAGLSQTESFFLNRIDKKNSRTLADLVYYFSDNKDNFRECLIEAAVEVFCSFEDQFRKLSCDGGERRAMRKLAQNASGRIFSYLLEVKQGKNVTKIDILKGIMEGQSKSERTVKKSDQNWKTSKIFCKTGIVIVETGQFYRKQNSHPEKYGHRRPFQWETQTEIETLYEVDSSAYETPSYLLIVNEELFKLIKNYIMSKDPFEQAKFEREHFSEKFSEETNKRYEEILKAVNDQFQELIGEMAHQYSLSSGNQGHHTTLLETILQNQEEEKQSTTDINSKLDVIEKKVQETKENQNTLISSNTEIKEDINVIKTNHADICNSIVKKEDLQIMVKHEADKYSVKNELKQILRDIDPGPSLKKEIEKGVDKLKHEYVQVKSKIKFKF